MNKYEWTAAVTALEKLGPVSDDQYQFVSLSAVAELSVFVARDRRSELMLGVAFGSTPRPINIQSEAFDAYPEQRPDKSWIYFIRLLNPALKDVFSALCVDLADEMLCTKNELDRQRALSQRVKAWVKLFSSTTNGFLNPSQQIGLIGELVVFGDLLGHGTERSRLVTDSWTGPLDAPRDFCFLDIEFEVKTVRDDRIHVTFSSLDQLMSDRPIRVVLCLYQKASKSDQDALSLNLAVQAIVGRIKNDSSALARFRGLLIEAGYVEHPYYDEVCVRVHPRQAFDVNEGFPALTSSNVPDGVIGATYQVAINAIDRFKRENNIYGLN